MKTNKKIFEVLETICYCGSGLLIGSGIKIGMEGNIPFQIFMSTLGIAILLFAFRFSDLLKEM